MDRFLRWLAEDRIGHLCLAFAIVFVVLTALKLAHG